MYLDLLEGEKTYERVYDRNDKLITVVTVVTKQDGFNLFDEDNEKVETIEDLVLNKYSDKLSVRDIELNYNKATDSYVMISNKLEK